MFWREEYWYVLGREMTGGEWSEKIGFRGVTDKGALMKWDDGVYGVYADSMCDDCGDADDDE